MNKINTKFVIINKKDERIYLKGYLDVSTIDDTDGGNWIYEQDNGLYSAHIPLRWQVDDYDLSDDLERFLSYIDWDILREYLVDFENEKKQIDCGKYTIYIN